MPYKSEKDRKDQRLRWKNANKEKVSTQRRRWYHANRERLIEEMKEYTKTHKEQKNAYTKRNADKLYDKYLKNKYGISLKEYEVLLKIQNNVCAICKSPSNNKKMAVDHDHKTGKVRGLLCSSCNTSLGGFKDNIQILNAAADYINNHNEVI